MDMLSDSEARQRKLLSVIGLQPCFLNMEEFNVARRTEKNMYNPELNSFVRADAHT